MSELTPCNYCSLRQIRKSAKRRGQRVSLRSQTDHGHWPKGQDVYLHPPGERPAKKWWVGWLAEITDHCVC